jgi:hypothetical protein
MERGGEIAQANVSDPFTLSGHPALGTLRFEPVGPAAVPEPSTCFLLTTGCVGLLVYGWRRRPYVAEHYPRFQAPLTSKLVPET